MAISQSKRFLKRFSAKIRRKLAKIRYVKVQKIVMEMSQFPDFPSSACTDEQYIELTSIGSLNTHKLLREATGQTSLRAPALKTEFKTTVESEQLKELFNKFGSDKSNKHNYHELYGEIIANRATKIRNVLEIGLGTNNPDVPSNMGIAGHPGASLRAWKEFDSECNVYGADIDARILFNENRIKTFQLDQLSDKSWNSFVTAVSQIKFDLIIDDGLHSPMANLNSVKFLMPLLAPGGILVVEDIAERSLPVWETFIDLAPQNWQIAIFKMRKAYIVSIKPE